MQSGECVYFFRSHNLLPEYELCYCVNKAQKAAHKLYPMCDSVSDA